jgi:MFS family permease
MTVFFAAIAMVTVFAPPLANHIGVGRTVMLACVLLGLGNVVFAASPLFSGLLFGRVLVGLGAGFAFVVGRWWPGRRAVCACWGFSGEL